MLRFAWFVICRAHVVIMPDKWARRQRGAVAVLPVGADRIRKAATSAQPSQKSWVGELATRPRRLPPGRSYGYPVDDNVDGERNRSSLSPATSARSMGGRVGTGRAVNRRRSGRPAGGGRLRRSGRLDAGHRPHGPWRSRRHQDVASPAASWGSSPPASRTPSRFSVSCSTAPVVGESARLIAAIPG